MILALLTLLGVLVIAVVVSGWPTIGPLDRWARLPPSMVVVLAGSSVQVAHVVEHVLQVGHWLRHPTDPPWLSSWARASASALSTSRVGVEALHLVGNTVFLASVVALVFVTRSHPGRCRWARRCLVVQGLHVAEHVALTLSVAAVGTPIGVSTIFGLFVAGPAAWSLRILLHFAINGAVTGLALRAIHGLATDGAHASRERAAVRSG